MSEVVRGVVIREIVVGESDKIITILAKDIGKISVSCKGSRKATSKTASGTSLFTYGDFNIYTGLKHFKLNSVDIIKSFYKVALDYETLIFASYYAEILDKIDLFIEENNHILFLLVKALKSLEDKKIEPRLTTAIFNFKLVELLGYTPILDYCYNCFEVNFSPIYFGDEGVLCKGCRERNTEIKEEQIFVVKYILEKEIDEIFNFNLGDINTNFLYNISNIYIQKQIDFRVKSLEILDIE
ncbi:MAG: DNA repair protein RecO [Lachnospirales bacterium]